MTFFVGQKVVCLTSWDDPHPGPKKGEVYTIRAIFDGMSETGVETGLHLVEIVHPKRYIDTPRGPAMGEQGWMARYFRPVTDISDLQSIVREQLIGTPRVIKPDQFDHKKVRAK